MRVATRVGAVLSCSLVLASCAPPKLLDHWMLLENPRTEVPLGDAWSGAGPYYAGCAVFDSTIAARSAQLYRVAWSSSAGADIGLELADRLGFGLTAGKVSSGEIVFDTLMIYTARDLYPDPVNCRSRAADGFPSLPVINELIGAKRLHIVLGDTLAGSLAAEVNGDPQLAAHATATVSSAKSVVIAYEEPVLVGMHLAGYSVEVIDTLLSPTVEMGATVSSGLSNWDVQVDRAAGPGAKYVVRMRYTGPGGAEVIDTVGHHESFPFGRIDRDLLVGVYSTGRVDVQGGADRYRVMLVRHRVVPCRFEEQEDAVAMKTWIRQRETMDSSSCTRARRSG